MNTTVYPGKNHTDQEESWEELSGLAAKAGEPQKAPASQAEFLMPLLLDSFLTGCDRENDLLQQACDCGLLSSPTSHNLKFAVVVIAIWDRKGLKTDSRDLLETINLVLVKHLRYASCHLNGRILSLVTAPPDELKPTMQIVTKEIIKCVEAKGMHCQIGVSRGLQTLSLCREGYIEAVNALSYGVAGRSGAFFVSEMERMEQVHDEEIQNISGKIEKLVRGGSKKEIEQYLDDLERKSMIGDANSRILSTILMAEIMASLYKIIYMQLGSKELREIYKDISTDHLLDTERTAENFKRIRKMCLGTKDLLQEQRKKSSELICAQAQRIIKEKYADLDLSVVSISDEIGVSPNYLSSLVRKNTGYTLIELLTHRRIQKAVELLCNTELKIGEITAMCGYKDQYYFSYCFKKAMGISPSAYRNLSKVPDDDPVQQALNSCKL